MWLGCVGTLHPSKVVDVRTFPLAGTHGPMKIQNNGILVKPKVTILVDRGYAGLSPRNVIVEGVSTILCNESAPDRLSVILTFLTPNNTEMSNLRFIPNTIQIS